MCTHRAAEAVLCAPQRFAAVIMRIRDPKTTALIFKSGKMVRGALPTQPRRGPTPLCSAALQAVPRG